MQYEEIKSFETACAASGYDANALPDVSMIPEHLQKVVLNFYELIVMNEALNREPGEQPIAERNWVPDYNDGNPKYHIWWDRSGPAGAFSYGGCDLWNAGSSVGSRLEYRDADRARHAAKHFKPQFREVFVID